MKALIKRYTLALAIAGLAAVTATAQTTNTGYYTQGYEFRHTLNPAFGNETFYVSIPALGNIGAKMQGNFGVEDVLFKNPNQGGKPTVTFMHPDISYEEAMKGINDKNKFRFDFDMSLISVGFKGLGGYNTVELNARANAGLYLPGDLFRMAKGLTNKTYSFDFGAQAMAYAELALGHSHQITKDLRVGGKLKFLLGIGMAQFEVEGMQADFRADQNTWVMRSGTVKAETYMKGLTFKNNAPGETFKDGSPDVHVDFGETDVDGGGSSGFGMAVDMGAEYNLGDVVKGLKVNAAIRDLGFISWSNKTVLQQQNQVFTFDGFKDIRVKDENPQGTKIGDKADQYEDQLSRFVNLQVGETGGSQAKWLAATMNIGAEYQMPFYDKLTAGLLLQHRFDGEYSWTEARLSANVAPLKVLSFSASGAINSFGGNFGLMASLHQSGFAFFIGSDHFIGKTTKQGVPLNSKSSVTMGMNISF